MREIKFRAWHTVKKVMFSAEEMALDQLTLLPTGQFINVSGSSTRLSEVYPNDKFIPLQYTGLKDKNGKEIYEGDITRINWIEGGSHKKMELTREIKWNGNGYGNVYDSPSFYKVKVIGNIYENPELLRSASG